jgi:hypothetical protein
VAVTGLERRMTASGRQRHRTTAVSDVVVRPLLADCRRCLTILEWRLLIFLAAQTAASMAEGQQAFVPIQSLPMQIQR